MYTASLENCKELYELSGWSPEEFGAYYMGDPLVWATDKFSEGRAHHRLVWNDTWKKDGQYIFVAPCYDLGYLLRKLPTHYKVGDSLSITVAPAGKAPWIACYGVTETDKVSRIGKHGAYLIARADTPEDAAALLAIQLFEQKILTPTTFNGGHDE